MALLRQLGPSPGRRFLRSSEPRWFGLGCRAPVSRVQDSYFGGSSSLRSFRRCHGRVRPLQRRDRAGGLGVQARDARAWSAGTASGGMGMLGVNTEPWPDPWHDHATGPAGDQNRRRNGACRDVWYLDTTHAIGRQDGFDETCPGGELSFPDPAQLARPRHCLAGHVDVRSTAPSTRDVRHESVFPRPSRPQRRFLL